MLQVGDELVSVEGVSLRGCSARSAIALLEEAMTASAYADGGVEVDVVEAEAARDGKGSSSNISGSSGSSGSGGDTATAPPPRLATVTITLLPATIALEERVSWSHLPSGARYLRIRGI